MASLLVASGCAGQGEDRGSDTPEAPLDTTSSSSAPGQEPTPDANPDRPRLISYAGDGSLGTTIRTAADADKLEGAPDAFKTFIGRTAQKLSAATTCTEGAVGVTVQRVRTDGYATGSVSDCGGYVALWADVDGGWKEIDATLDLWDCAALTENRVPAVIAGDSCYDTDAKAQRSYPRA